MIYLDSCIVIYLVERHPEYYSYLDRIFRDNAREVFATSSLVALECLVGPYKRDDEALEEKFEKFFAATSYLQLNDAIYLMAAGRRARYSIKTPDALHLSTAEFYECTEFWTNDNRLEKASPIVKNVLVELKSLDTYGSSDFGEARREPLDYQTAYLAASNKVVQTMANIRSRMTDSTKLLNEESAKLERGLGNPIVLAMSLKKVATFMHGHADGIKNDSRKLKEGAAALDESLDGLIDAMKRQPGDDGSVAEFRDTIEDFQAAIQGLKDSFKPHEESVRSSYGLDDKLTKAGERVNAAFQQLSDATDELIALTELALEKIDLP